MQSFGAHNSKGLKQAVASGTHWLRLGAFRWERIEPARTDPPTYRWGKVDEKSLKNASRSGMEIIAIVRLSPEWALKYPGTPCGPIKREALPAYGQFLKALVERYSQPPFNIRYWELGNEPDIDHRVIGGGSVYGCWGDADTEYYGGGYYAEMLKVAYPAIKEADPNAKVLLGGLLLGCDPGHPDACNDKPDGAKATRFLEGVLRNGGGDYFDIVSYHAYVYFAGMGQMGSQDWPGSATTISEKAAFLRSVLEQYGYGDKPLMNTEGALLCKDKWLPLGCYETQAVYVPRAYAEAMAVDLKVLSYYALINDHWWNTGLINKDFTPRPAYRAYVVANDYLSSAQYIGPLQGYLEGIVGYEFRGPAGRIELIWSKDGNPKPVDLPAGASAYNRFGEPVAASGQIQVDYGPFWVVTP